MTTDKNTNTLFTEDGMITCTGGRINFNSADVKHRLLIADERTIGFYQNEKRPSEKHLSFTFREDITNGTHSLKPGSPFLAANFHEALNNELDIQTLQHYKAVEGSVNLYLVGTQPDQIGYLVTDFKLTLEPLTTGEKIQLSGNFRSYLTYTTAN